MQTNTPRTETERLGSNIKNQSDSDKEWPWSAIDRGWDFARILERELAAVTAERDVLRGDLCTFAVDMEKQLSALTAERDTKQMEYSRAQEMASKFCAQRDEARAERDALKAKLATINHVAMSLFVRSTSSEVTGEMAEIGRLSREDGQ